MPTAPYVRAAVALAIPLLALPAAPASAQEPAGPPPPAAVGPPAAGPAVPELLASLNPPQAPGSPPVSGAEQVARLTRAIESDESQLRRLKAELDDPSGEYAQAEAEFRQLDERLVRLRKSARDVPADEAGSIGRETADLEKTWKLAKDRFDLAIEERKALHEQIAAIEEKLGQERAALDRLSGRIPTTKAAAPEAPGDTEKSADAKPSDAGAPDPTPSAPAAAAAAVPGLAATAAPADAPGTPAPDARPPAAPRPESRELVEARVEARKKSEVAEEARREARSITERLAALDRNIALEKALIETARRRVDNADQTRSTLTTELESKAGDKATEAERRDLVRKIREAASRLAEARAESREHSDRLDELQSQRSDLLTAQLEAARRAAEAGAQVERAEQAVAALENPFAPRNLLRWAMEHGLKLAAIVAAMAVLLWLSRLSTRRVVALMAQGGIRGSREEREARASTLVGVFHNAASVAITVGGILMVLQEVGIPIAPLLGGAAIFGLAVAFGAQNLIRDYFYGFVILLENQYKLNDVVRIGATSGQVERITLRMTVLRDLEGNVHFIPNGEITTVTNMTHGWSRALIDVGVAYKEDVDRVIAVIRDVGRELRRDPDFRLMILDDLEVLGVEALGDSAVVLRSLVKTRTLKQWPVRRELLRRLKKKFDELGIEIPFPQRTLHYRADDAGAPAVGPRRLHHGRHEPAS